MSRFLCTALLLLAALASADVADAARVYPQKTLAGPTLTDRIAAATAADPPAALTDSNPAGPDTALDAKGSSELIAFGGDGQLPRPIARRSRALAAGDPHGALTGAVDSRARATQRSYLAFGAAFAAARAGLEASHSNAPPLSLRR